VWPEAARGQGGAGAARRGVRGLRTAFEQLNATARAIVKRMLPPARLFACSANIE